MLALILGGECEVLLRLTLCSRWMLRSALHSSLLVSRRLNVWL